MLAETSEPGEYPLLDGVLLYLEQERVPLAPQQWAYRNALTIMYYSDFCTVLDGDYRPRRRLTKQAERWLGDLADSFRDASASRGLRSRFRRAPERALILARLMDDEALGHALLVAAQQGWDGATAALFLRSGLTVEEMQGAVDAGDLGPVELVAALRDPVAA